MLNHNEAMQCARCISHLALKEYETIRREGLSWPRLLAGGHSGLLDFVLCAFGTQAYDPLLVRKATGYKDACSRGKS